MHQNEDADTKTVRVFLMLRHEDWRVPERRVRKFVKRHRNQLGFDNVDDDASTFSNSSSVMESVALRAKALRSPNRKNGEKVDAAGSNAHPRSLVVAIEEKRDPALTSPLHNEDEATSVVAVGSPSSKSVANVDDSKADVSGAIHATSDLGVATKGTDETELLLYNDDNDGKKQGSFCQACVGCNIL